MIFKIFLDDKSFHFLKHTIPSGSRSKFVLQDSTRLNLFGIKTVISCDEGETGNLLLYASHCRGVIVSIHNSLHSAGLKSDNPEKL